MRARLKDSNSNIYQALVDYSEKPYISKGFSLEILEYFLYNPTPSLDKIMRSRLKEREQYYMENLDTEYNIQPAAGGTKVRLKEQGTDKKTETDFLTLRSAAEFLGFYKRKDKTELELEPDISILKNRLNNVVDRKLPIEAVHEKRKGRKYIAYFAGKEERYNLNMPWIYYY